MNKKYVMNEKNRDTLLQKQNDRYISFREKLRSFVE